MQLATIIGAVALLSNSVIAVPGKMEKKSPQEHRGHQQVARGSNPSSTIAAASSSTPLEIAVMTEDAPNSYYSIVYVTVQSSDASDFGSFFTTQTSDVAAPEQTGSTSRQRHHHTHKQHISLTSSLACPATVSTSFVTVTASVISTSFVSASQSYNSSTVAYNSSSSTQTASQGFPSSSANFTSVVATSSSSPAFISSAAPSNSSAASNTSSAVLNTSTAAASSSSSFTPSSLSSTAANSGVVASGSAASASEVAGSSASIPPVHHHTRHRMTRTRHHHHTPTPSSSITTSVFISATPISVATGTNLHPSTSATLTTTISGNSSMPTGTPAKNAALCGIHGLPAGDYFLGVYYENSPNVPVTTLGCYEICMTDTSVTGCQSYEFYTEPGLAPGGFRCNLYGSSVSESIDTIRNDVTNVWYDLGCGTPAVFVD